MAIQPIDLQVMFNQLDQVGKTQASQKEGLAIQQALQGIQVQKETEEAIQAVNEAQDTGAGTEGVKDRGARKRTGADAEDKEEARQKEKKHEDYGKAASIIRDPSLGKNVDVSG
ncbi:MAG: hypothetical protein LBT13_02725 [Treponema sp.]|jgi:TnpA family transposase|nr:hypothetical protein [Treponema sp.]